MPSTSPFDHHTVIARPRLTDALDRCAQGAMTLLTAPAGYGKSVLIESWLARRDDLSSVYVSLDERDNDASRFWLSVVEGLAAEMPAIDDDITNLARFVSQGSADLLANSLTRALSRHDARVVLVLDDFQVIDDGLVIDSLDLFRDAVGTDAHIMLSGRHDPRLPVSRLRVRGDVQELREADLRFTLDETRSLLELGGIEIDDTHVAHLWERTEGWPAALRLALVALLEAPDPERAVMDFSGTTREMAAFLFEQVLAVMPPRRREFMYSTSVVDEISGDLANRLSGRDDGASILSRLEWDGFFTRRIPGHEDRYRYHDLIRQLLVSDLAVEQPARLPLLHEAAAEWYLDNGDVIEAVRHYLEAGNTDRAIDELGAATPKLVATGQARAVIELTDRAMNIVDQPSTLLLITRLIAIYSVPTDAAELDALMDHVEERVAAEAASAAPAGAAPLHGTPRFRSSPRRRCPTCREPFDGRGVTWMVFSSSIESIRFRRRLGGSRLGWPRVCSGMSDTPRPRLSSRPTRGTQNAIATPRASSTHSDSSHCC